MTFTSGHGNVHLNFFIFSFLNITREWYEKGWNTTHSQADDIQTKRHVRQGHQKYTKKKNQAQAQENSKLKVSHKTKAQGITLMILQNLGSI